jgi:DNA recombination protein RmuC
MPVGGTPWLIFPPTSRPDELRATQHRSGLAADAQPRARAATALFLLVLGVSAGGFGHGVTISLRMSAISLLVGLLLGIVIGAAIGYLLIRSRLGAADERARAAEQRAMMIERSAAERAALLDGQLAERFQALSAQALDASTARFLEVAEGRLRAANAHASTELETRRAAVEHLVGPLKETLARVEAQLRASDEARTRSHAALAEQVDLARQTSEQLRTQTQALVTALRRPEARGRWGELQLRRVVELAGMSARCDFDEQVTVAGRDGTQRPDLVVHLADGKNIVVDSKVSLAAYLEAAESDAEDVRAARMDAHARHLREHVDRLAGKAYWAALSPSPEFVILFIPGEAFLAPALERDPGLLEYALSRKVHIATPTTLVTMLRTAQYAWQQAALADNARAVFDVGRELYDRIAGLGKHVDRLGQALAKAVSTYNQAVGSLESRVLPKARRLNELGVVDAELDTPRLVEETTRALSAPELVANGAAGSGEAAGSGGAEIEAAQVSPRVGLVRAAP